MILGFKTQFPWGAPTHFEEKITKQPGYRPKIHTLREGERWKSGDLINFATGVRSKNYKEFNRDTCKSTQQVVIVNTPYAVYPWIFVDGQPLRDHKILLFVYNDGFDSLEDFARWFHKPCYVLQLIHWTDFKY